MGEENINEVAITYFVFVSGACREQLQHAEGCIWRKVHDAERVQ